MTVPTFVSIGTLASSTTSSTSGTPALPASRVNGNVLIAWVEINGSKTFALSSGAISNGWNLYGTQITGNVSQAFAWRIVDGNEAACVFTWTPGHAFQAICFQYTGNDTTSPIGNVDTNTGSTTIQGTIGAFASRANSGVVAIISEQGVGTPSTPSGWSSRNNNTLTAAGTIATRTFTAGLANIGDSTNPSFGSTGGLQFGIQLIEILSPNVAPPVSTTIAQTLSGFTQAATPVESEPSTIAMTLFAPTQSLAAFSGTNGVVAQTLLGISQEIDATESVPLTIAQTLRGFTQEIDVSDIRSDIAQTLPGFTQEVDIAEQPKAAIATVFAGLVQEMDTAVVFTSTIDQRLPGFLQESDDAVVLDTTINMILGQPKPPPDITVSELSHQGSLTGSGFVRPFATTGASDAGKLIVIQIASTATSTSANTITALTNIPGQPAWQQRAQMLGSQPGSAVGLETWYLVSNSAFGPSNVTITMHGNQDSWESIVYEYGNIDTDQPWDTDSSVPASSQNNSLTSTSLPSISGLATANDFTMQVGYFASNTTAEPSAGAGFTRDAAEQVVASSHTSSTAIEISKLVPGKSSGLSVSFGSVTSAWCMIADTIRGIATARSALTQEIDVTVDPAALTATTLFGLTQEIDVMSNPSAAIDTLLHPLAQTATAHVDPRGHIDQTFMSILQKVSPTVVFPPGSIVGDAIQTLPKLSQEMDVTVSAVSNIAQTLPGLVQEFDTDVTTPNVDTSIDTTLAGLVQEIDIDQSPAAFIDMTLTGLIQQEMISVADPNGSILTTIDQTLPGFTQEIDATLEIPVGVDTVLSFAIFGLQQEADVIVEIPTIIDTTLFAIVPSTFGEIIGVIDQTLPGFSQEIDDDVELVFRATIDQTLPSFGPQEADVTVEMAAAIDQTLPGFQQEADVNVEMVAAIDQVLAGLQQEADVVVEMEAVIDMTLTGLMQELDATTQDETTITTVLPGFGQAIIVEVDNPTINPVADIAAELMGFSQRCQIVVTNPKARHGRGNSGMVMPSKDMPIHPGELELFRRKVYARNVDGLVPISPVAQTNLTTTRYPHSRPAVNRTPLGKPKS